MQTKTPCVLLLRPSDKAVAISGLLAQCNIHYMHVPMLALQYKPSSLSQTSVQKYQHLVFVSSTAVDFFARTYRFPEHACYWAVGTSTQQHLAQHKIYAQVATPPSIETIATHLVAALTPNSSVLLVAGVGGRRHLAYKLQHHPQVHYRKLSLYTRTALDCSATTMKRVYAFCTIILIHSITLLNALIANLAKHGLYNMAELLHAWQVIAVSPRIAQAARKVGFVHVFIANDTSDASCIQTVQSLIQDGTT